MKEWIDIVGGVDKVLGYLFFVLCTIYMVRLRSKYKNQLWGAIVGEDNKLQLTEAAALYWFVLFPMLFLSDLFLGLEVSSEIWYSMDAIFGAIVLGHTAKEIFGNNGNATRNTGAKESKD